MTTRLNTIEYAFQTNFSTLAASTTYNFTGITVTMPETTSRVFESVYLEVFAQADVTTSAFNTTAPTGSLQLGAATAQSITFGADASGGTQYHALFSGQWLQDLTAYFTAHFGGASTQTVALGVKWPVIMQNISARLIITYQFTDADNTRAKTVRIPIDGYAGSVPTSLTSIGSSTDIPNLSTFCPEGSATFTNVYFEIEYVGRLPSVATFVTTWGIDGTTQAESTHQATGEAAGAYAFFRVLWQQNSLSTSATHQFQGQTSVANTLYDVCVTMVVTYTYSESGTTSVLNSIIVPFPDAAMGPNTNSTSNRATWQTTFYVEEPATVTLVQSAVRLSTYQQNDATAYDAINLRVGTQTYRSYTHPGITTFGGVNYGQVAFQQRFDSGASEGAGGFTLARGPNTLTFDAYGNGAGDDNQAVMQAYAIVNYTSGVASGGTATHNKTIKHCMVSSAAPSLLNEYYLDFGTITPISPPETAWWCNGIAFAIDWTMSAPFWFACLESGEKQGSGSLLMAAVLNVNYGNGVDGIRQLIAGPDRFWDRNSAELDTGRLNPFTGRRWMRGGQSNSGAIQAFEAWFTYHSITFNVAGTASGYTGSGSGITVNIHRSDTGELTATATTSTGGSFSTTVFDNVTQLYAEAYQDSTHLGRSALGVGA